MLRPRLTYVLSVLWMIGLGLPFIALMLVCLPSRSARLNLSIIYARLLCKFVLVVGGVKVEVSGQEHLNARPGVLAFNHTNTLDFFLNASNTPSNTLVFGKRVLMTIPVVGLIWWLGSHPLINRSKRTQWQGKLDDVADNLRERRALTWIAPEGTRNYDGKLGRFKKGAFHIAVQSGAPIIPVIITNAENCWKGGMPIKGTVGFRFMKPIPTSGWKVENLEQHMDDVRKVYLAALGQSEPEPVEAAENGVEETVGAESAA